MSSTKLTFRIWGNVYAVMQERMALVRRDLVLDLVLQEEIRRIDEEISIPNSDGVRDFLEFAFKSATKGHDGKPTSILLSTSTAEQLDSVCNRKKIPRDCLLNRVILMLVARPQFMARNFFDEAPQKLKRLALRIREKYADGDREIDAFFGPIAIVSESLRDPFWGYRELLEELYKNDESKPTLHTHVWQSPKLIGFNCSYPEEEVPGTAAYAAKQIEGKLLSTTETV